MSAVAVSEAEYRVNVGEMFKALDMDRNDFLDWDECRDLVSAVMRSDGGYDADAFKVKYDAMDKNADGKISKTELIDAVVGVGRERNLFGDTASALQKSIGRRAEVSFAVADNDEDPVDT